MSRYNYRLDFIPVSGDIPVGYIPSQRGEKINLDISKITNIDLNLDIPFDKSPGSGSQVVIPLARTDREITIFDHGMQFSSDWSFPDCDNPYVIKITAATPQSLVSRVKDINNNSQRKFTSTDNSSPVDDSRPSSSSYIPTESKKSPAKIRSKNILKKILPRPKPPRVCEYLVEHVRSELLTDQLQNLNLRTDTFNKIDLKSTENVPDFLLDKVKSMNIIDTELPETQDAPVPKLPVDRKDIKIPQSKPFKRRLKRLEKKSFAEKLLECKKTNDLTWDS